MDFRALCEGKGREDTGRVVDGAPLGKGVTVAATL